MRVYKKSPFTSHPDDVSVFMSPEEAERLMRDLSRVLYLSLSTGQVTIDDNRAIDNVRLLVEAMRDA